METTLLYLANASLGIALFYAVYWLFLRKETFHSANRWFLLTSLVFAVVLPLMPLRYEVFIEGGQNTNQITAFTDTFKNIPVFADNAELEEGFDWQQAILLIYLTGAGIFLIRLLAQTAILLSLMVKHRIRSFKGVRILENEKYGLPFSFFNIVFINPKFHTQDDLPEILAHEKVHIRENHWFDLLIIELLTVIFWFNPFIWFFERSIKQNHEYLADKGVLAQGHTIARYQALLVNQLMGMQIIGITNNLNFALSTNRFKMMTKKKTPKIRWIRFIWALPVLSLLLFAFAEPNYQFAEKQLAVPKITEVKLPATVQGKKLVIKGIVTDNNNNPMPGTSIIIKGSTLGTVADMDGSYTIEVPNMEKGELDGKKVYSTTLVASFVGYGTRQISVNSNSLKTKLDFVLNRSRISIDPNLSKGDTPPPPPPPPLPEPIDDKTFYIVEELPEYPGGSYALSKDILKLKESIKRDLFKKNEDTSKYMAIIGFTVDTKGKVTNIKVLKKNNDKAAKGAFSIVFKLKDWKPGSQRGKKVSVDYVVPIVFD